MPIVSTGPTLARGAAPKPGFLSVLIAGCFAAQPLFAQTTTSTEPPVRPPQDAKADAKAAPVKTGEDGKAATTSTPEVQSGAEEVATIEVVAARPTNKIDRDVYDLKTDISVSNASAADILNNVPSVTVDQDGNVQLRGNSNVQIMVNGKRDAQFQGQNRGDALNAFPAEAIESIEVINVPGAEFGNEGGSGPIINIILKRNRKPGSRATLSANKGGNARENAFLNGEHAAGPYSISGNIGLRRDLNNGNRSTQRENLDPQTGNVIGGSNSSSASRSPRHSLSMASTFSYNVGERDQAAATASFSRTQNQSENTSNTYRYGLNNAPTADYTSRSHSDSPAQNFGLGASYVHKSGEPGEELKFDLRYTGQTNNSDQDLLYDYRLLPTRVVYNNQRFTGRRNRIVDLSVDYQRVVFETWQLKAGGKLADSKGSNSADYFGFNPQTGLYARVPNRSSDFESNDQNVALYTTLATKFGGLSLLGGLRAEYTTLKVHQPLLAEEDKYHYMNWLPSFYATYDLSDTGTVQLRASRRIARPNERFLNPNLVYLGDFSATQGNPDLHPVNNDLAEMSYRDRFFDVDSSFTLFERRESPVVAWRSFLLASDPDVLVTSPVNFGGHSSQGMEVALNTRNLLIDGLSANFSTTISNDKQQRLFNLSTTQMVERTIHRESAKIRLAYQFAMESLQLTVNHNGPTLAGQGINKAFTMTSFAWQHRLSPQMTLNFNVQNVFNVGAMSSVTENEVLRMHSLRSKQPRVFNIGLRYQWGGVTGDQRIRNGGKRGEMFDGPRGDRGNRGTRGAGAGGVPGGGGPGF